MDNSDIDKDIVPRVAAFMETLYSDVLRAEAESIGSNIQYYRRAYVRAAFAYVEGGVYAVKRIIRAYSRADFFVLSDSEAAYLDDKEIRLRENGLVEQGKAKISLTTNLKFTFVQHKKWCRSGTEVVFGGTEWNDFQRATQIRDRLTHPKILDDSSDPLTLTEDEIATVKTAVNWLHSILIKVFEEWKSEHKETLELLENVISDEEAQRKVFAGKRALPAKRHDLIELARKIAAETVTASTV